MSCCLKVEKSELIKKNLFCRYMQPDKNMHENTVGENIKRTIVRVFVS